MDDYIDVKIDVFENTGQRARLRKNLTVVDLIQEVLKEFDDIGADSPEKYAVYLKGFDRPLTPTNTLIQLDIQPQDELVFDYVHQTMRQMLEPQDYATLREETTGKEFDIQWQPAVIGRPSTDIDHNIMLAANVQLLPNGVTVSRSHAQITFSEGRYYIEPLAEYNPVFLNGKEINYNKRYEIKNGDKIMLGHHKVMLIFNTQTPSGISRPTSAPRQSVSAARATPEPQATIIEEPDAFEEMGVPKLVIEAATDPSILGQIISLETYPYPLGRIHPLLNNENEVSRQHAEITSDAHGQKFYITDLKSTNGVAIDGKRIPTNVPVKISPGCRIKLGTILVLRFEI
jgi:pSer/pThr/pTyr-binding forkhead associated (FHA) protein